MARRGWRATLRGLALAGSGGMTGCAIAAFIPPAYFDGISTTRHMVGMNLATALAFPVSIALAGAVIRRAVARPRGRKSPKVREAVTLSY